MNGAARKIVHWRSDENAKKAGEGYENWNSGSVG